MMANTKKNDGRKNTKPSKYTKEDVLKSLGLTKVKGKSGKTYWE